jgi:hypothetical protein
MSTSSFPGPGGRRDGRSALRSGRIGPGQHLAVDIGHDHVGHVRITHRVLDHDEKGQLVIGDERGLRARSQALRDGQAPLRHLRGEALLLLAQQEQPDEDHGEADQRGDEQAELPPERHADTAPGRSGRRLRFSHPLPRICRACGPFHD